MGTEVDGRQAQTSARQVDGFAGHEAREIIDAARDAFVAMDANGRITAWNVAAETMFGYSRPEAVGTHLAPLIIPEHYRAKHDQGVARFLRTGVHHVLGEHREYEGLRRSGDVFPIEVTHWSLESDGDVSFYAFIRDITDRKSRDHELLVQRARASELTHRMLHDDLTGLASRSLAVAHITKALARRARYGGDVAVLFVDLDRFKLINDNLGHAAGDELLCAVAQRLHATVRSADAVARVAGDEFLVLCDRLADLHEAEEVAGRVVAALAAPVDLAGERIRVRCSVGIAGATDSDATAEDLLRNADAAMYRAKERGRAQIALFDDSMRERMRNRLHIERELAECIDGQQLCVRYRPILDLHTEELAGVQPLVCWQHPRLGLLEPVEFAAIAEQTGMMLPILLWGERQWSADAAEWAALADTSLFLGIDLMARQVADGELVGAIVESARRHGSEPGTVRVFLDRWPGGEVSGGPRPTGGVVEQLVAAGVTVGAHGFGTDAAPLSQITSPGYGMIKLAPGLVHHADTDPRRRAVARAVAAMAQEIGMTVFVDGLTSRAEREVLARVGCHFGQGELIGGRVTADVVSSWL